MKIPAFFDGHCDTVLKVVDKGTDFANGDDSAHVDFPRLRAAGVRAQVFACFVLSERYPGAEVERAEVLLDALDGMIGSTGGAFRLARTAADVEAAFAGGPSAAVFALEGADPLEGRAENLRRFFSRGVRDLIFAWKDNPFSGTAFGSDVSLSREGERLLGLAEDLGVMVDVSHLSDAAFDRVCEVSERPFIASHSNCRGLCPVARNLTDRMIRTLAERGGVMGINLSTSFLSPKSLAAWKAIKRRLEPERLTWRQAEQRVREEAPRVPRPPFDWIVRHILHAIDVGGEDVVGLGGDLDGIVHTPQGIDGVEDYPRIPVALREAGLSEGQVEKVCFRNFLRVFGEGLPG